MTWDKVQVWITANPRLAYFIGGAAAGSVVAALFWIAVLT